MNIRPVFPAVYAAAASFLLLGASHAYAGGDAGAKGTSVAGNSAKTVQQDSTSQIYGSQLMTPEERTAYRQKMREAKTFEEREKIRTEHHTAMQARAKERGVTLPDAPPARGPGMGSGMGSGMGPGMGPGKGPGDGSGTGMGPGRGAGRTSP